MTEPCLACGAPGPKTGAAFPLTDRRMGLEGNWQAVTCTNCGVLSIDPMPTEDQLATYYADYAKPSAIDFSPKSGSRHPRLRRWFHCISGDVDPRDFVEAGAGSRILDYGCGNVGYLADFHARGYAISGAELNGDVVDLCVRNGFDVRKVENFSKIPFSDQEFDIVYLMQVFEHLRDPNLFLAELARVLKPGGVLYLSMPNANSAWRRIFGAHWVSGWFAPFHLFHYTESALTALAGKHGFTRIKAWSATPESWFRLNLQAWLSPAETRLDKAPVWFSALPIRLALTFLLRLIELPLRNRDCLVVCLRKR